MSGEATTTTNGSATAPPAAGIITPPADASAPKAAEGEKPKAPTAAEWAAASNAEKRQRAHDEKLKREREALEKERAEVTASKAEIDAVRSGDPSAIMKLLGGIEGYNKLTTHLLKQKQSKAGTAQPQTQTDINAAIAKAIEEHEAKKTAAAEEAKKAAAAEEAKAADAFFASLTTQSMELVSAGGERYEQIARVVGKNTAMLDGLLREVQAHLTSADGWKVRDKVHRGGQALDTALDLLEDALVERAETLASPKVRARLQGQAGKPAEAGGTRKSETGGPSTLTSRLSQESTLSSTPAASAAPPGESPLARKQREEAAALAKTIADTDALLKRAKR